MTQRFAVQYFLGANAPTGFYSLYSELLPPEEARRVYLLKGGPGCGKSTLMRRVGAQLEAAGLDTEYILCSGDPDSLDGLLLPELGVCLADATAPHVLEPKYPGAVERYLNLGDCYDYEALHTIRQDIMDRMKGYKGCYARAYRCLEASAELSEDVRAALLTPELSQWLARRARGILHRELKVRRPERTGRVKQRFLSAVTHRGYLCLYDTALAQCSRIYELQDTYGLAHELLLPLLTGAVESGHDVVACPDPMAPDRLAHLLIPDAGVAFVSSTPCAVFPDEPDRRIRLDTGSDSEQLRASRARLRFAKRMSAALMDEAVASLDQAKAMHDELEALYNPHVDFERVNAIAETVGREILELV